jgi:hypothetical protein
VAARTGRRRDVAGHRRRCLISWPACRRRSAPTARYRRSHAACAATASARWRTGLWHSGGEPSHRHALGRRTVLHDQQSVSTGAVCSGRSPIRMRVRPCHPAFAVTFLPALECVPSFVELTAGLIVPLLRRQRTHRTTEAEPRLSWRLRLLVAT